MTYRFDHQRYTATRFLPFGRRWMQRCHSFKFQWNFGPGAGLVRWGKQRRDDDGQPGSTLYIAINCWHSDCKWSRTFRASCRLQIGWTHNWNRIPLTKEHR